VGNTPILLLNYVGIRVARHKFHKVKGTRDIYIISKPKLLHLLSSTDIVILGDVCSSVVVRHVQENR
jgi:hypothetical protein